METSNNRPDRFEICFERGIEEDYPGYGRLTTYATIPIWLSDQYAEKTDFTTSPQSFELLADLALMGALADDQMDTGEAPDWEASYEPILLDYKDGQDLLLPPNDKWKSMPPALTQSFQVNFNQLGHARSDYVSFAWNSLMSAMYEHKQAVVLGQGVAEVVGTRVLEAVTLSELLCSVLFEDPSDYNLPFFRDWLTLQIAAGNLADTIIDYREDLKNGHMPLSTRDKAVLVVATIGVSKNYLAHPMTSLTDVKTMLHGLTKAYIKPLLNRARARS